MGAAAGLLIWLTSPLVLRFYQVGSDTLVYARQFTWITAAIQPFQALADYQHDGVAARRGRRAVCDGERYGVPLGAYGAACLSVACGWAFRRRRCSAAARREGHQGRDERMAAQKGRGWIHETLTDKKCGGMQEKDRCSTKK